jgi:plasmid stabilization system protein ParE
MFRIAGAQDSKVVDVLRILHDSMDLERYRPFTESD